MTIGRPTLYKPEYCEQIIELGKQGKSIVQMACEFGVIKQTLDNWAAEHPDFLVAFTRAKHEAQNWWENTAQTHMVETPGGTRLNPGIWSRSMAARFPADYQERKDIQLGGQSDNPLKTEVLVKFVATAISEESEISE
jgi:hypothetical protein